MSTTTAAGGATPIVQDLREFLAEYYRDEIGQLAQRYPKDQRSLEITFDDLSRFDSELARDWLTDPEQFQDAAEEALVAVDLPADVSLENAHVRLTGLDDGDTYYPGEFSPKRRAGEYLSVQGQVERATEVYAIVTEAAFECQRCGTTIRVVQTDRGFQEPHECHGCERQGPFSVNLDASEYVDGQKLRVAEPPEVTQAGDASHIDVFLEDDLVDHVTPGDKVAIAGVLHLEQESSGNQRQNKFTPYLDGEAVELRDTEFEDIDITPEERERLEALSDPEEGDIYDLARDSIAPGIRGEEYEPVKLAIFLQLVAGARAGVGGQMDRGDFHQLLIGDPSTGKSDLQEAAREIAPRAVSASGKGATKAGMTASAVRDDFTEGGEWSLEGGALVQASDGIACIDELDKTPTEVAESMHRAMEQQEIPVNKAGINATLPARTSVLAAANPKHSRWDPYEPDWEQIDLSPTLLSRFALIWKLSDRPDEERDRQIARAMLQRKETAKKRARDDLSVSDEEAAAAAPAIETGLLRKYIAHARRQPDPVFGDGVMEAVEDAFVSLRTMNGTGEDAAVPVSSRKLGDVQRLAEAAARAELSDTIQQRHVDIAQDLVGESLRQFGVNEEGEMDADIVETGRSKTQHDRVRILEKLIRGLQGDEGGVPLEELQEEAAEHDIDADVVEDQLEEFRLNGDVYEPALDEYRWTG